MWIKDDDEVIRPLWRDVRVIGSKAIGRWHSRPLLLLCLLAVGCTSGKVQPDTATWQQTQGPSDRVLSITGLSGPEAVRYDSDQDVYFVSNFNGEANARDANGFISRVRAEDGSVETEQFMVGTEERPMHAPRGMMIVGDTLWVADIDGIHGFDRTRGTHLAFIELRAFEPGFLNDIAAGPDGSLYVSDTGRSRIYLVLGGNATIAIEGEHLGFPNGVTWDSADSRLLIAPWAGGGGVVRRWRPGSGVVEDATPSVGDRVDGIEIVGTRILVAVQSDSSIYAIEDGRVTRSIQVGGAPADIGIDTRRERIAVPFIALNRVDVWRLPK